MLANMIKNAFSMSICPTEAADSTTWIRTYFAAERVTALLHAKWAYEDMDVTDFVRWVLAQTRWTVLPVISYDAAVADGVLMIRTFDVSAELSLRFLKFAYQTPQLRLECWIRRHRPRWIHRIRPRPQPRHQWSRRSPRSHMWRWHHRSNWRFDWFFRRLSRRLFRRLWLSGWYSWLAGQHFIMAHPHHSFACKS